MKKYAKIKILPSQKNNILQYDTLCMQTLNLWFKKMDVQNNPENSSKTKAGEHTSCGRALDNTEHNHTLHLLLQVNMLQTQLSLKQKEMLPLTK